MSQFHKKECEKLYLKYLNEAINLVGNSTTWSNDIHDTCVMLFGDRFKGVFASDRIPYLQNKESCILNLSKTNQKGSHWISVISEKGKILIYDSFGRKSSKIIPSIFQKYRQIIDTENDAEQNVLETNCGARCIAFLMVYYDKGYDYAIWI